jgi:hypothetical protein
MEQWERYTQRLQHLADRQAYVKAPKQPPVKITTLTVNDRRYRPDQLEQLCIALAKQSGRPVAQLEKELDQRWPTPDPAPQKPVRYYDRG